MPDPLHPRLTRYIPYPPHPPQQAFLLLSDLGIKEALYGGAAGGGKSDALLMAALQYVDVPGYAALLLRKTYADLALPGAIMDRSKLWLTGTDARWSETDKTWRFPAGATLSFGYLQTANDKYRYQGAEFQYVGFDELTQFDEDDYLYLFSRLRKPEQGQLSRVPVRMRAASNPPATARGRWVDGRFAITKGERVPDRVFIPAKLPDNPSVNQEAYRASLGELDPQTRAQLLDGDWTARQPGNYVFDNLALDRAVELGRQFDQQVQAGTMPEPVGQQLALGVDWGDFHSHAVLIWELERGGIYVPQVEVATSRQDPEQIALTMLERAGAYPWRLGEERYDASFAQTNRTFAKVAERTLGPHNPVRRTGRPNTVPVSFGKYKSMSVGYLRLLLRRVLAGDTTRVLAISPTNTILLEQMYDYQQDELGRFEKGNDDAVDALIAGAQPVAKRHRALVDELRAAA
jgi:hypothetical protein